jgi:hypothetical protein
MWGVAKRATFGLVAVLFMLGKSTRLEQFVLAVSQMFGKDAPPSRDWAYLTSQR